MAIGLERFEGQAGDRSEAGASSGGNLGDFKWLGGGIGELRIDVAAGYRVYFTQKGQRLVLLLVGGDKSTQAAEILKARKLLKEMK